MTLTDSTTPTPTAVGTDTWTEICPVERLTPDRGVAALVEGHPIAVFLLSSGDIFALSNIEPFTGASVLSRGLVGDVDGIPTVASPLHKQRFDLRDGRCLDESDLAIDTYPATVADGRVLVSAVPQPTSGPTSR